MNFSKTTKTALWVAAIVTILSYLSTFWQYALPGKILQEIAPYALFLLGFSVLARDILDSKRAELVLIKIFSVALLLPVIFMEGYFSVKWLRESQIWVPLVTMTGAYAAYFAAKKYDVMVANKFHWLPIVVIIIFLIGKIFFSWSAIGYLILGGVMAALSVILLGEALEERRDDNKEQFVRVYSHVLLIFCAAVAFYRYLPAIT